MTDTAAAWFNLSNHIGLELANRVSDPKKPVIIDAWAKNNKERDDMKLYFEATSKTNPLDEFAETRKHR